MSWGGRNFVGPIKVPAGKDGDDFIDWMCRIWGTRVRRPGKTVVAQCAPRSVTVL